MIFHPFGPPELSLLSELTFGHMILKICVAPANLPTYMSAHTDDHP